MMIAEELPKPRKGKRMSNDLIFEATIATEGTMNPDGRIWTKLMLRGLCRKIISAGFECDFVDNQNTEISKVIARFPMTNTAWQRVLRGESITIIPRNASKFVQLPHYSEVNKS